MKKHFALAILSSLFLFFLYACTKKDEPKTETKYTVTFNTNGGNTITSQIVSSGSKVTQPNDPIKTGYTFAGWYTEYLRTIFDFDTSITNDQTIYAKWNDIINIGPAIIINSKTYKTITIGTQTWMAENLNDTSNTTGRSVCLDNGTINCNTYGRLYNWEAAMDIDQKIAGWHLPTDAEWTKLDNYLDNNKGVSGQKMKVGGGSGFEAILGGFKTSDGTPVNVGSSTAFWSSTISSTILNGQAESWIWCRDIYYNQSTLNKRGYKADYFYSIRLIKD